MSLREAERLVGYLEFMVVTFPAIWVLGVVVVLRIVRRHHIEYMHLYGPPELRRKILDQKNRIKWRDRKIERLEAERRDLYAILRGVEVTTAHTQQALAGVIVAGSKAGRQ